MKIGITAKLFCAILSVCILIAFAMLAAVHYNFSQGFIGYLNDQEDQRVESLRPVLAKAYQEHGGWDFLRGRPQAWFSLTRPPGMPPPPDESAPNEAGKTSSVHQDIRVPPEVDLTGLNLRITLLDERKNQVIGAPYPTPSATLKPIEIEGKTIGWLALLPFDQVSTGAAGRFQQQQLKANALIGVMAILLAALAALLFARLFLAPVKRIAAATHALAAGNYANRVMVASGDELGRLAENFNQLAQALEKNEQLRREFMADVSHELRTPLAVLQAELEAMEDGIRPTDLSGVKSLQSEVATLGKLVNDLYELSLSDVGALAYRKRPVDVVDLLVSTARSFETHLAARTISLELDTSGATYVVCHADPDRLRQLFTNLLQNSLRYTDAGGKVVIRSRVDRNNVTLEFEDTAPGVPAELLPRLFDRFFRGDQSRNRATGGAGLGLAISRNIVEAHQGTIIAHSSPLGGLRIAVTLPLGGGQS